MATITGDPGNNVLNGTALADVIRGLAGHDTLNGNNGDDVLEGGVGDDFLNGGAGIDIASYEKARGAMRILHFLLAAALATFAGLRGAAAGVDIGAFDTRLCGTDSALTTDSCRRLP